MKTNSPRTYYCHLCNDEHIISTYNIFGSTVEVIPCPKCERDKYYLLPNRTKYEWVTPKEYESITVTDNSGEWMSLKEHQRRMKEIRTSLDKVRDMINLKEMTAITSALGAVSNMTEGDNEKSVFNLLTDSVLHKGSECECETILCCTPK